MDNSTPKQATCKRCGDTAFYDYLCLACSMGQTIVDYVRTEYGTEQLAALDDERKERSRAANKSRKKNVERLPFDFTQDDRRFAFEYFNGRCAVCGRPLQDLFGEVSPSIDHWIPVCDQRPDNPGTVPKNIVPLCIGKGGCNDKKGGSDPVEWLIDEFGDKKAREIIDRIDEFFSQVRE